MPRQGRVASATAAHIAPHAGNSTIYAERFRARQCPAKGWIISQKAGMVEYTTQASHPMSWSQCRMRGF
jgi:hypothetical protein